MVLVAMYMYMYARVYLFESIEQLQFTIYQFNVLPPQICIKQNVEYKMISFFDNIDNTVADHNKQ